MSLRVVGIVLALLLVLSATMNLVMYQRIRGLESDVAYIKTGLGVAQEAVDRVAGFDRELRGLADRVSVLEGNVSNMESRIGLAVSKADEAVAKVDTISSEVMDLKNTVSGMEQRIRRLEEYNSTIAGSLEDLYKLYNDLLNKYRELEEKVNKLSSGQQPSSGLAEVVASVQQWYFWYSDTLASGDFIKKILDEAVKIPVVQEIISNASISSSDPLLTRIWKVINYTSLNLMYRRDSYVRVPTLYGGIRVWHDSLQLPNETVSVFSMGGDCEDLAILVYAVLKATARPGEEVYLLIAYAEPEGHVAVLAIDKNKGEAYIVDPSYSLVNGWAEMVEIEAVSKNGTLEKRYLNPMAIDPRLKEGIFMRLKARVAYIDAYKFLIEGQRIVSYEPQIYDAEPSKVIEIWKTITHLTPSKYVVASDRTVELFTSDEVLASWIAERLG